MADKYVALDSGKLKEKAAIASSAGAGDAGKIPALDGAGKISATMMPVGIGADTKDIPASEALAGGDWVNIWNDTGAVKVRKADATGPGDGKKAHGFVIAPVDSGATASVYFEGTNTQMTGLTPGSAYYLATTAGGETVTSPSAAGNISQVLGVAVSATEINFEAGTPIEVG